MRPFCPRLPRIRKTALVFEKAAKTVALTALRISQHDSRQESKAFFFEKRSKKLLDIKNPAWPKHAA
jgi:hypothetical protein